MRVSNCVLRKEFQQYECISGRPKSQHKFLLPGQIFYMFLHILWGSLLAKKIVDLCLDFEVDRIGILPLNKVYLGVLSIIWG